jgi:hypothetical protein
MVDVEASRRSVMGQTRSRAFCGHNKRSCYPRVNSFFAIGMRGLQCVRLPAAKIELRQYPYLAPYGLTIIKPTDSTIPAYYRARILPFRRSSLRGPLIIPTATDQDWVEFIEGQFASLWDASSEVDLLRSMEPETTR